jgi:hypothetical protein
MPRPDTAPWQRPRSLIIAALLALAPLGGSLAAQEAPSSDASDAKAPDAVSADSTKPPPGFEDLWRVADKLWLRLHLMPQLDIIHDFDAIGSQFDFVTSTIPVDGGTLDEGSEGRTTFSPRASRISFDGRGLVGDGFVKAFVAFDFFTSGDIGVQLREAYFELNGLVGGGDLVVGQTYSTFVDTDALPETLDYEGPTGSIFIRLPLLRWQRAFDATDLRVSIEAPESDVKDADGLTGWPDFSAAGRWRGEWGHVKVALLLREIRATADSVSARSQVGAGGSFSGTVQVTRGGDNFVWQASYGTGIGRYLDDPPSDGFIDPVTGDLETLPVFGGFAGFQHWWLSNLRSTVIFSPIFVNNPASRPDDALKSTQYVAVNLIWSPYAATDFGVEWLWGQRVDEDGESGTANRIQFTARYTF